MLDGAIEKQVKVSFSYLSYDVSKKLVPRRTEPYIVNPYGMVYTNEQYYLICNLCGYENMSLYRIDRIRALSVLEEPVDGVSKTAAVEAAQTAIYACTGEPEPIEFVCEKFLLNDVIDRFGTGITILDMDDRYCVHVTVAPRGMKFWALQYLPYVEVKKPEWLRQEIITNIKTNPYQVEHGRKNNYLRRHRE